MKNLIKNGLCTGCGVCVSESCSKKMQMAIDANGFFMPTNISPEDDVHCIKVCPFNPNPESMVQDEDALSKIFFKDATSKDFRIGAYENTYIGYSSKYRETSSSGGIATYIFEQLLELKIVDRLYVVQAANGRYQYQFFDNKEQITSISKTRYYPVTMATLFTELDKFDGKVAVSGVGCFIKAIRLKQAYHSEYKEKIPFLVGIICGGLKSTFFSDFLASSSGVKGEYDSPQYRIKDSNSNALDYSFGCIDKRDNHFQQMKMSKVGDMWGTGYFKSNACDFCTDVTTELADISLGDAWLDEYMKDGLGTSVIITRSKLADKVLQDAMISNELIVEEKPKEYIIQSQSGSFTHRQDAIKVRSSISLISKKGQPAFRKKFKRCISITYFFVQICRRLTRKKSLAVWLKYSNANEFNKIMFKYLFLLKVATKFDHLYRKIKRKLFK